MRLQEDTCLFVCIFYVKTIIDPCPWHVSIKLHNHNSWHTVQLKSLCSEKFSTLYIMKFCTHHTHGYLNSCVYCTPVFVQRDFFKTLRNPQWDFSILIPVKTVSNQVTVVFAKGKKIDMRIQKKLFIPSENETSPASKICRHRSATVLLCNEISSVLWLVTS